MKYLYILIIMGMVNAASLYSLEDTNQAETNQIKQQQTSYQMPEVIVTANRYEQAASQVGESVTVIDQKEIKKWRSKDVAELIRNVQGVEVFRNGGFGGLSQVSVRGVKAAGTLVMIDGVAVNDPINTSKGFDFSDLSLDNIEQIEIFRGPNSALYGSEAMGGVINIITKKGHGERTIVLDTMAGSYNTFKYGAGASGSTELLDYSVYISKLQNDGFSKAAVTNTKLEPEKDPYNNTTFSGKLGYKPFDNSRLSFMTHYTYANADVDYGAYIDSNNLKTVDDNVVSKLEFQHSPFEFWDYRASLSYFNLKKEYNRDPTYSVTDPYSRNNWFHSDNLKGEFQNKFKLFSIDTVTAGLDAGLESGASDSIDRVAKTNTSVYLQNQISFFGFANSSGIRADFIKTYGTVLTYKIASIYAISNIGFAVKGNFGTGFKEPTLYQLYSLYGNTNLNPESLTGFDIGISQSFGNDFAVIEATYFQNDTTNLIDWAQTNANWTGIYTNKALSQTRGIEAALKLKPFEWMALAASYTYTSAYDINEGISLPSYQIPMHKGSISASIIPLEGLILSCIESYVGKRYSFSYDARDKRVEMPDYFKTDISISYKIQNLELYGNIDNLLDAKYQEVYGYNTAGVSFYGGLRIYL